MSGEATRPQTFFERLDSASDALFYAAPRLVNHIDDATITALSDYYVELLKPGADVLDLMSSWVSHLPVEPALGRVAGLGMNAQELEANPRLTEYCVHDLNAQPRLPFAAASFDQAFIAVSIQYLIQPIEVLTDVARVLRPAGRLVVAMSHRCFPTKAIRAFHGIDGEQRMRLVADYFAETFAFSKAECIDRSPKLGDPLWLVTATTR
jgi:SAM-dependent methyltransferase